LFEYNVPRDVRMILFDCKIAAKTGNAEKPIPEPE
jgi:hypothetical protein